jgi:thermitase
MLRKRDLILLFLLIFCLSAQAKELLYVPGQLLVKFRPSAVSLPAGQIAVSAANISSIASSIKNLNQRYQLVSIEKVFKKAENIAELSQTYKLLFPSGTDVMELMKQYSADPNVEYAEPNYIYRIFTPNDTYYTNYPANPNQWGLFNVGLTSTGSGTSGWDFSTGEASVKIAIIDTGVCTHEDLLSNLDTAEGWNFVSVSTAELIAEGYTLVTGEDYNGPDGNFNDVHGHGTHCSGIASASTNNGKGIAGAGWNCRIMPVKAGYAVIYGGDVLGFLDDSDSSAAIVYAADHHAKVLSLSFGGTDSTTLRNAINYALSKDCVIVAAAGNDNSQSSSSNYPAAYSGVLAVAATDRNDQKASYSNYGSWVGISAPGGEIIGSTTGQIYSTYLNNTYEWMSGTSMATPLVAGIAGLVRSKYPLLSNSEVVSRIKSKADNIDAQNPFYIGKLGSGRINAFYALTETNPPTVEVSTPHGGESLWGGDTLSINFTATDDSGLKPNSLNVAYSSDGGATFGTIIGNAPIVSPYSWHIPKGINSSDVMIRVQVLDIYKNTGSGISGTFTVSSTLPAVSILNPSGGENITGESTLNINYVASTESGLPANPITLYYSTDAGGSFQTIASSLPYSNNTLGTYAWKAPAINARNAKIRVEAQDLDGVIGHADSNNFSIITDILAPVIKISILDGSGNAVNLKNGDYISTQPKFKAVITDDLALDPSSIKLYFDNIQVIGTITWINSKECELDYAPFNSLLDESVKTYAIKVEAADTFANVAVKEISGLKASTKSAKIIGPVLSYPTVIRPSLGQTAQIAYNLTANADIAIYLYGLDGQNIWTKKFTGGTVGGVAGYNQVLFDGKSDLGGILGNGLYVFKIVSGGSVIGTGHVLILD